MALSEFATDASRNFKEDLETTRERLGKSVFQDQKRKCKEIVGLVSKAIDGSFSRGRTIRDWMSKAVDSFGPEEPTPISISIETCFKISRDMQHEVLQHLSFIRHEKGNESSSKVAAALDIISGFENVIGGLSQEIELGETGLAQDPKGFRFVKKQAEFWSSPDRVSDGYIKPYEDPKLIAAGAKLAPKTYKRMYPIAEKVLSSGR